MARPSKQIIERLGPDALTRALDRWMAGMYPSHGRYIAFALRRKS